MVKVTAGFLRFFILWIFFMLWQGEGHEDFSVVKMVGMMFLIGGAVGYIYLDS